MKPAIVSVASAITVALAVACAGNSSLNGSSEQLISVYPALGAERLHGLVGLSALEALRMVPGYSSRANRPMPSRFVLILDGTRSSDLEPLRAIRATDLFEIHVVGETATSTGDVEVVVTTLAGLKRVDNGTARPALSYAAFPVERLRDMSSETGFDALSRMPAYLARVHQTPAPPFVLILDGLRIHDLEMLKTIQARDLFEIRVVGESQSITGVGAVEVMVTTLGGRTRP